MQRAARRVRREPQERRRREGQREPPVPWARRERPAESECWAEAEYRPEWRGEVDYSYRKK